MFWELVKFTFNIRISKVLAALWPRLLTRQSLFVPPGVFRGLSQQFQLHCIRIYIHCGSWRPAKPALLKVLEWKKKKKDPSGRNYFDCSQRHLHQATEMEKYLFVSLTVPVWSEAVALCFTTWKGQMSWLLQTASCFRAVRGRGDCSR